MTEARDSTTPDGSTPEPTTPGHTSGAPDVDPDSAPETRGARPAPGLTSRGRVKSTRAGAWWTGLVLAAIIAIFFLVFIVQNSESVNIKFLGLEGSISLAVALLASAVAGALVVAVPGVARVIQLRRALAKSAKAARS